MSSSDYLRIFQDEVHLFIRVKPGSKRLALLGVKGNLIEISLTAPALQDRANEQLIALLASAMGVPKSSVRIKRGRAARTKTVIVAGRGSGSELANKIAELLGAESPEGIGP